MSKKDSLSHYIKVSNVRLSKVKHGEVLEAVLKSQQLASKKPENQKPNYQDLSQILLSSPSKTSKAMKEYQMQRSFSEKLERQKHQNLPSFFAVNLIQEKYKFISFHMGEKKKRQTSILFDKNRSSLTPSATTSQTRPKNKSELLEMKMKKIDKEISEMFEMKNQENPVFPERFIGSINRIRKSAFRVKQRMERSQVKSPTDLVNSQVFGEKKTRKLTRLFRETFLTSPKSLKTSSSTLFNRLSQRKYS